MIEKYYMGIDPGKKGGVAIVDSEGQAIKAYAFEKLTEHDISSILSGLDNVFCVIEKVHAYPNRDKNRICPLCKQGKILQGISSTMTFGINYGFLLGCLVALKIPHERISPQKWKAFMGCLAPKGKDLTTTEKKNIDKAAAQRLFPKLKITHAIADALLLAKYRYRTEGIEFKRL